MHFSTGGWSGNGDDYYGSAETKGLRVFDQGGTVKPKENDILCFGGGPEDEEGNTYGHVAIITEVGTSYVKIIDQNRTSSSSNIILQLSMTVSNGHYSVASIGGSYYVQGWLRGYTTQWDSQNPASAIDLAPGEMHEFKVWFTNTSRPNSPDWTNNGGDLSIELRSCDVNGAEASCFFLPVDGKPAWLDPTTRKRIVRASSSGIGTDETALFDFWGKIPLTASEGQYHVYFRPYHNSGQWIQDWGGMQFVVNVADPKPEAVTFQSLTGKFTNDGYTDVCLYEDSPGDLWVSANATTDNEFLKNTTQWLTSFHSGGGNTALSGDIGGSDLDDICLLNRSLGRWWVAYSYGDHFSEAVGDRTGGMWLDDWGDQDVGTYTPFIADFNDDGYADACLYEAVHGNWYVALRDLTGNRFVPTGSPWITGYGDGVGSYQPIVGDFNADGYADIGLYKPSNGYWYVAFNMHNSTFERQGQGAWITGFGDGGTYTALVGQFNGDDHSDIGLFQPSTGNWFVAFNYGDHFTKENGPESYGAWITGYGNGTAGLFRPLVGQFSWDAYSDIGLYQPEYGRWFVAILDGNPYRFTRTDGIYTSDSWLDGWGVDTDGLPKVVSPEEDNTLPTDFTLSQNYPNPFNPVTTISYSLPTASQVKLDVYNILGQRVATLVNGKQEAGEHQSVFDCSSCASGIYLYRLATDQAVATKKMILLK